MGATKMDNENLAIQNVFESLMHNDPDGLLKPEALVKAAESTVHPLHDRFEWDDTVAAEKYRIQQARDLIQTFRIEIPQLKVKVRALTSLDVDRANGGGYRWTMEVLERPDLREEMVHTALRELNAIQLKYSHLQELNSVWAAIKEKK